MAPFLRVLEPAVLPGMQQVPAIKELTYRLLASRIRAQTGGGTGAWLWVYSPHALRFIDLLRPARVIYDIADDYSVPTGRVLRDPGEARELRMLDELERRLLERADVVFCVSEPLREKAASRGAPHAQLLPNGCDFDAYPSEVPPPRHAARPVVGYVGTVAPRTDVELIEHLARLRPGWSFEIVGPVSPLVTRSAAVPPNLSWVGEVPYSEVPARIARFDAGMLPLREIDYAYKSSPIQVFDYLAAGKPVVSSPIAQFERWPSIISTVRGAAAFVEALDRQMAEDSPARQKERRAFARLNSWDARASDAWRALVRPS